MPPTTWRALTRKIRRTLSQLWPKYRNRKMRMSLGGLSSCLRVPIRRFASHPDMAFPILLTTSQGHLTNPSMPPCSLILTANYPLHTPATNNKHSPIATHSKPGLFLSSLRPSCCQMTQTATQPPGKFQPSKTVTVLVFSQPTPTKRQPPSSSPQHQSLGCSWGSSIVS